MSILHFSGRVQKGEGLATRLGCPTANVAIEQGAIIPPLGVYVGEAEIDGRIYPSLICINSGKEESRLKLEVHILSKIDFELVGKRLSVKIIEKLRDLVSWESMEQIADLVAKDMENAKAWFGAHSISDHCVSDMQTATKSA